MSVDGVNEWMKGVLHYARHLPGQTEHPLEVLVLRGHLLLEEQYRELVRSRFKKPEIFDLSRFPFMSLVRLAHALCGDEIAQWVWDRSKELNGIRNSTAHELQDVLLKPRIEKFIAEFEKLDPETFRFVEPTVPSQLAYSLAKLHHEVLRFRHIGSAA